VKEVYARMDEDDDFFDMRSRFKLPEKRQKRPLGEGDESNSDSSGSGALSLITLTVKTTATLK